MDDADDVMAGIIGVLRWHGPATTSEVTAELLRSGVEVDSGRVHALLTTAAIKGTVRVGSKAVPGSAARVQWSLDRTPVLCWDAPDKAQSYEEWASYQADSAPPGTYAPNMSDLWKARWKAKLLGQRSGDLRVEVRKSTGIYRGGSVQVKLVIGQDGTVVMSMNGTAQLTRQEFAELGCAVAEARAAMTAHQAEKSYQELPDNVKAAVEEADDR